MLLWTSLGYDALIRYLLQYNTIKVYFRHGLNISKCVTKTSVKDDDNVKDGVESDVHARQNDEKDDVHDVDDDEIDDEELCEAKRKDKDLKTCKTMTMSLIKVSSLILK